MDELLQDVTRIAAPRVGGLASLNLLTLVIVPVAYVSLRAWGPR